MPSEQPHIFPGVEKKVNDYVERISAGESKDSVLKDLGPSWVSAVESKLSLKEQDEVEKLRKQLGVSEKIGIKGEEDIYGVMSQVPVISPIDRSKAPFKNFSSNNEESWEYVSNNEIEDYLGSKLFFDTHTINEQDKKELFTIHKNPEDESIKIPLDLVVHAAGFIDWRGRDPKFKKTVMSKYFKFFSKDSSDSREMTSLNIIKHYASLPSELPPVDRVTMYTQPDGKIFFDNASGDSHRIAAAILRGEKTIDARNLVSYQLSKNYL